MNNLSEQLQKLSKLYKWLLYPLTKVLPIYTMAPAKCDTYNYKAFDFIMKTICSLNIFCLPEMPLGGQSYKAMAKYVQDILNSEQMVFQKYDYGALGNLFEYKQLTPPKWDVSSWKIDTVLINGTKDVLVADEDLQNLIKVTKISKERYYILEGWGHLSYMLYQDKSKLFDIFDKELP